MNFRFALIFALGFILLSCQRASHNNSQNVTDLPIDTNNAAYTFSLVKDEPDLIVDSVYEGLSYALMNQGRFPQLFSHLDFYQKRKGSIHRASALRTLMNGYYYSHNDKIDSADIYFRHAVNEYQQLKTPDGEAAAYSGLIGNALFRNDYKSALSLQYKALNIYEQLGDSVSIYAVLGHMALVHEYLGDTTKALSLLHQSLHYYERTNKQKEKAHTIIMLASLYHRLYKYDNALSYALIALPIFEKLGDPGRIAQTNNLLGTIYYGQKNWNKAINYFYKSKELGIDKRQIPHIDLNIAASYESLGKTDSALALYQSLLANTNASNTIKAKAQLSLSDYYQNAQQYNVALSHYREYKRLSDSVYSAEKARSLNELNVRYETEKNKEVIQRLKSEQKVDRLRKLAYLLALALTVALCTIIIFLLRKRNRMNKERLRQMALELQSNQKELLHFTERFLSKNKLVEEMEARLTELEGQIEINQDTEQLSELYQFKILTEEDWQEFKILFDKVHPGLISKLRSQYPDLAPAEERQFLLIRLNIDNKESANMLGISIPGVKKNRYRLKKRFGLGEEDNLDDFVKQI
jgi:tetratricopeptide (TPR) repeat protein